MKFLKKNILLTALILLSFCWNPGQIAAQSSYKTETLPNGSNIGVNQHSVVKISVPLNTTTHFVSPEPIDYVDISTPAVQGDMSAENLFRIRPVSDVVKDGETFTVTIVTQSFITVYEVTARGNVNTSDAVHIVKINPNDGVLLNQSDVLSRQQCFDLSVDVLKRRRNVHNVSASADGMKLWLNGVYVFGDYILLDVKAKINSKLQYNIDNIRFKIVDKKQLKATVSQDIEITPYYTLYPIAGSIIYKKWRNFFVFKKFTYPSAKFLNIEMSEKQYSGRKIELNIEYNQVLKATNLQ